MSEDFAFTLLKNRGLYPLLQEVVTIAVVTEVIIIGISF